MRQLLLTSNAVKLARMPAPRVERGMVLVKVEFSMISVGTEIAGLRKPGEHSADRGLEQARQMTHRAGRYMLKAFANPRRAADRLRRIALRHVERLKPIRVPDRLPDVPIDQLTWHRDNAKDFSAEGHALRLLSDQSEWQYQAHTDAFKIPAGYHVAVDLNGEVGYGKLGIGILDSDGSRWLGSRTILPGALNDRLIFDPQGAQAASLVLSNAQGGETSVDFSDLRVQLLAPSPSSTPHSEMDEMGWNIGYSAAGRVIGVGVDTADIQVGDLVACSGAGRANHADFVLVPRNLVCRVPQGCDLRWAATTTVGSIAMQGVRRAHASLGERICVIGLGLLGQITVQLLRAAGCSVIGFDLNPERVERAKALGMEAGTSDSEVFPRLVRDFTQAHGADKTLITAATKSDIVINTAMEVTRRRGVVVIVGDVGLNVHRSHFYRKEIDLLMSTSYGPGRYDTRYEEAGQDYPFAYVRWTLNRNMQSYMDLIATGRLHVDRLVDVIAPVDEAPQLYEKLANHANPPLAVLLSYSASTEWPEPLAASRIHLRGARTAQRDKINYVLVGAGAYGQSMLVPMMDRRQDCFFLRGVVSRDAVRGGNFVRERRLELFASDLGEVLQDPDTHLLVVATRHCEHATQVMAGLNAGKHVFVEKPLAITWQQLEALVTGYESLADPPLLMVGFNRRFSPALVMLRSILSGRSSPLVINYRLNGGYIPLDHWIQTEQGGGRNIGEACHMYDAFRMLAGAPVSRIEAVAINPGGLPYLPSDNFSASISYQDGSIGNLVYTALGPKKGLPKERIEVFCDGEAYVVDDFRQLTRASSGEVLWSSNESDKGQALQMELWADALMKTGVSPIAFEELVETTSVALYVEDLIHGRQDEHD